MCGNNRRRQARLNGNYGPCGRRDRRAIRQEGGGITAIVGALHQMKLGMISQPQVQTTRAAELDKQTQGVVFPFAADEKKLEAQQDHVDFEELPSYEQITGSTPTQRNTVPVLLVNTEGQLHQPNAEDSGAPLPRSNNQMMLERVEQFRYGLEQYKTGVRGGKRDAKRAVKQVARALYHQELDKRRGERGYLECGERKEVRRELRPVKQLLKDAVQEAKRERKRC